MQRENGPGLEMVGVPGWEQFEWLWAGFSTRWDGVSEVFCEGGPSDEASGGTLNLGYGSKGGAFGGESKADPDEAVAENRRRVLAAAGGGWQLAVVRQVHGTEVRVLDRDALEEAMPGGRAAWEADGLMTDTAGLLLGAGAADCVPLLLADTRQRVVAALHAGWRGTAEGMAGAGLRRLATVYGTKAEDCVAAVGPSIGRCCYEVGAEVAEAFEGEPDVLEARGQGRWQLDLWEANRRQLLRAGLPVRAIAVLGECTACTRDAYGRRRYFSHRAERGRAGRMLGMIGVRGGRARAGERHAV